jgi:hypothetical protein
VTGSFGRNILALNGARFKPATPSRKIASRARAMGLDHREIRLTSDQVPMDRDPAGICWNDYR